MLSIQFINTGNGRYCFCLHFRAISFAGHLNEYLQFACLQQLIRCFLFVNVNESISSTSTMTPHVLIIVVIQNLVSRDLAENSIYVVSKMKKIAKSIGNNIIR